MLPSKYKLETTKATRDTCLDEFNPQLTTHGVDLDPQILFKASIFIHGLELLDKLICCISLDARLLFNGEINQSCLTYQQEREEWDKPLLDSK